LRILFITLIPVM